MIWIKVHVVIPYDMIDIKTSNEMLHEVTWRQGTLWVLLRRRDGEVLRVLCRRLDGIRYHIIGRVWICSQESITLYYSMYLHPSTYAPTHLRTALETNRCNKNPHTAERFFFSLVCLVWNSHKYDPYDPDPLTRHSCSCQKSLQLLLRFLSKPTWESSH